MKKLVLALAILFLFQSELYAAADISTDGELEQTIQDLKDTQQAYAPTEESNH